MKLNNKLQEINNKLSTTINDLIEEYGVLPTYLIVQQLTNQLGNIDIQEKEEVTAEVAED